MVQTMKIQNFKNSKDYIKKTLASKEKELLEELGKDIDLEKAKTEPFAKVVTGEGEEEQTKFAFTEK